MLNVWDDGLVKEKAHAFGLLIRLSDIKFNSWIRNISYPHFFDTLSSFSLIEFNFLVKIKVNSSYLPGNIRPLDSIEHIRVGRASILLDWCYHLGLKINSNQSDANPSQFERPTLRRRRATFRSIGISFVPYSNRCRWYVNVDRPTQATICDGIRAVCRREAVPPFSLRAAIYINLLFNIVSFNIFLLFKSKNTHWLKSDVAFNEFIDILIELLLQLFFREFGVVDDGVVDAVEGSV